MFNCHFGFPPEEGSSTYWTNCTPYIKCQVDQVQDLTILRACDAYSSLKLLDFSIGNLGLREISWGRQRNSEGPRPRILPYI